MPPVPQSRILLAGEPTPNDIRSALEAAGYAISATGLGGIDPAEVVARKQSSFWCRAKCCRRRKRCAAAGASNLGNNTSRSSGWPATTSPQLRGSIPAPTWCCECRSRRNTSFRR